MRKIGFLLVTCLCATTAHAGGLPTVDIVSPGAGECVNNGGEIATGGILGGEVVPDQRNVPVSLALGNPGGGPLSVTFLVDGIEQFTARYDFPIGQQDAEGRFDIPSGLIQDGERKELEVIVRPLDDPQTSARDTVVFQLDRQVPFIQVDLADLDAIPDCPDAVPDIDYVVTDNSDPDPQVAIRTEVQGCIQRTIYTATDTCGNGQEYELVTSVPAPPGTIEARLVGYRCGFDGFCDTFGPDAVTFDDGARVGRAAILFELAGPPGCIDGLQAVVMTEEDYVDECPDPNDLQVDPDGNLINPCPSLVPGAAIDVPGGYVSRLVVSSCGQEAVRDELAFTVLEPPMPDPGGPYQVEQGQTVMLDASGSVVAPELGGLVAYAWDLNGDLFFDAGELGEDLNNNGVQDPFETDRDNDGVFDAARDINGNGRIDFAEVFPAAGGQVQPVALETDADGVFAVQLRITAGNGAEAVAVAEVEVLDVDPDCQIGGPYEALEGEALTFDAGASGPGHFTDELVAWNWDFGDGRQPQRGDDLPDPSHIYRQAGEFTVTLRLEDIDSASECQTQVVVREVEPIVAGLEVIGDEDALVEGRPILLSAGDTRAGSDSDPLVAYTWEVRRAGQAGAPLQQQTGPVLRQPEFILPDQGDYEICLTVRDEDGDTATGCIEITVADVSPIAVCAGPPAGAQIIEGTELVFNAAGTRAGGPADEVTRIEWDFGDGEPPRVIDDPDLEGPLQVRHTFRNNGQYTVNMTVFDEDDERTCSLDVRVLDTRPVVALDVLYAPGETSGFEGEPIEFDASRTVAGADAIVSYEWTFGDGNIRATDEPRVQYAYGEDGDYQVRVVVRDADGSSESATVVARVANRDPEVRLEANEMQVELGQEVRFRTVTNGMVPQNGNPQVAVVVEDVDADLPPRVVEWDFGDGTPPVAALDTTHRFAVVGEFTVTVLVEDGDGGMAEAEIELEVTAAAPRIEIVETQTTAEGQQLTFDVRVEAPQLGDGVATLQVNIPAQPAGSDVEIIEDGADRIVRTTWTPTYYQAGRHTLQIRAAALEVQRSDRTRNVTIDVTEAGTPRLAAVGGTPGRGVLTLYDYGADDFRAVAEVELGLGAAGLAAQADGRRVFVAVPGSNRVAVVQTTAPIRPTPVRRIPVGRSPSAVVAGGAYMWVINAGSNDLTIIETATLKVVGTASLAPLEMPTDAVWLPEGFDGLAGPRLAVVARRSGHIAIVDPEDALAGRPAVEGTIATGGVLTRVVSAPTGWLHVADAKTRRIYRVGASDVAAGRADAADGVALSFQPRDLVYQGETLYVATGAELLEVADDGAVTPAPLLVEAQALTTADDQILGGGALVVASPTRISNLSPGGLAQLRNAGASRVRRMTAFVALE